MPDIKTRELYRSSNGDRWFLCTEELGHVFVVHQPNAPSGGRISRIELADFLSRGQGPEQQALLSIIASTLEAPSGELMSGEADPGLSLAGAGGHA
jgi:hypothetical protein